MKRKNCNFINNSNRTKTSMKKKSYNSYEFMSMKLNAIRKVDNKKKEQRKKKLIFLL